MSRRSRHGRRRDPDSVVLPTWWPIAALVLLVLLAVLIVMAIQGVLNTGRGDVAPAGVPIDGLSALDHAEPG